MGKKVLLDKITITDKDSSQYTSQITNFTKLDFVTVVYDEDDEVIENFASDFNDLTTSDVGFRGDYFDGGSYITKASGQHGDSDLNDPADVWAYGNNVFVVDRGDNDVKIFNKSTGELITTFDTDLNNPVAIWIIEDTDRAHILDDGDDDVKVFNISDLTNITRVGASDYGGSTLSNAKDFYIDETAGEAHILDSTDNKVYVIDITDGSDVTNYGTGVISLGVSITLDEANDRTYVNDFDSGNNTIRVFVSSTGVRQSGEETSFGGEGMGRINIKDDSGIMYVNLFSTSPLEGWVNAYTVSTWTQTQAVINSRTIQDVSVIGKSINALPVIFHDSDDWQVYSIAGFPTTLVYPNARDYINKNIGTYWRRNPTNHIFRDGDDYVYFQPFTAPPYFLKRSQPISSLEVIDEDLVDDLEASITNYTEPSDNTTADGSITVTASGTHTPFTYQIIGPNNSNESPQASGTFSNLTAGTYQFRIIDDNNVKRDLPPFQLNWTEEVLSDYGVLYDFEWYDVTGNINYKLEVVKRGYAGMKTTLSDMGTPPFSLTLNPNGSDIVDTHIVSLTGTVTFVSETMYDYIAISQGNDEDYGVIFYVDDSGFQEYFRGMISPRSYSETISGTNHYTSFTVNDRTGDLKNLKYRQKIDTFLGSTYDPQFTAFYGGKKTLFQILHYCLRQLKMDMGYRIALNLFEDSHNTAASDDPLNQTKVDTDSYFDDRTDMTLQEVVTHILKPFKAYLVGYEGYWYIIDKENLSNASISYVEYNQAGTYVTNSTWSPRIDFKAVSQSSRFRWVNNAQIMTTEVYKDVLVTLDTKVIEEGLTPDFITKNLVKSSSPYAPATPIAFTGWQFVLGSGESVKRKVIKSGQNRHTQPNFSFVTFKNNTTKITYDWVFEQSPEGGGDSRIIHTGLVNTGSSDDLSLTIKLTSGVNNAFRVFTVTDEQSLQLEVPFIKLRWKLKIGNKFYNYNTGKWINTSTTNVLFVKSASEQTFDLQFNAPSVAQSEVTYKLVVYPPDITDYDLNGGTSEAAMITALKAVTTASLNTGSLLTARYKNTSGSSDVFIHYYYELQYNIESGSEPDVVDPTDRHVTNNPVRWRLIAVKSFLSYDVAEAIGYATTTYFKEIRLGLLPNGSEAPEEAIVKWRLDQNNKVDFEDTLYHFDAPPLINSPMELYYNHFFTGTRTPTDTWNKSGGYTRRIQDHYVRWLAKKLKRTRFIVSGDIHYDNLPTPISVLRDTQDDNALYMIAGGEFDFKTNHISGGTYIEIQRDTDVPITSVSSGVSGTAAE